MSKSYIATIMDRHYLTDTTLAFSCNRAILGKYDEEEELFIDKNGNYYPKMGSEDTLTGEVEHCFANVMSLEDLSEYFENTVSLKEAVVQYERLCKEYIHFIGIDEKGEAFYTVLTNDFLHQLSQMISSKNGDDYDSEYETTFEEDMNELMEAIIEGKFTLNQLKEMRARFNNDYEYIEAMIETLDIQISSIEDDLFEKVPVKEKPKTKVKPIAKKKEVQPKVEKKKSTEPKYINIDELFNKVTKTLIAQDEPARRVITELARKELDDRKKKEGILLTGPTGVGKTELMRLIAKHLDRPFHKINSTKLTSPGYVGKDIEEELWELYVKCGKDLKKTERAIIFFDEVDKKGSRRKDDVSGKAVLNVLLPFIEGSTYDACSDMRTAHEKVKIDTSNMTVILGGAYTDVYKNLIEKNGIGFNANITSLSKPKYRQATTKDFIDYGMMTDEFMGRVTVIKLNDLDVDDIKRVMLESDESAMKIQEEIFKKLGVKLTFTDGFTTEIAKQAEKKKTGARGLNGIIDAATWQAFEEVYKHQGDYEEVVLDENTVEDSSNYQLVKKKK